MTQRIAGLERTLRLGCVERVVSRIRFTQDLILTCMLLGSRLSSPLSAGLASVAAVTTLYLLYISAEILGINAVYRPLDLF